MARKGDGTVRLISLGGIGDIGKNMTAFEQNGEIIEGFDRLRDILEGHA